LRAKRSASKQKTSPGFRADRGLLNSDFKIILISAACLYPLCSYPVGPFPSAALALVRALHAAAEAQLAALRGAEQVRSASPVEAPVAVGFPEEASSGAYSPEAYSAADLAVQPRAYCQAEARVVADFPAGSALPA
jgi:hypothetical protein